MGEITRNPGVESTDSTAAPQPLTVQNILDSVSLPEPQQPRKNAFDIAALRLSQSYEAGCAETVHAAVNISRPSNHTFFQAHPTWHIYLATLLHEQTLYAVTSQLQGPLDGELALKLIVPYIDRDANIGLWPLSQLQATGKPNTWTASAHRILAASRTGWVRMRSNSKLQSYDLVRPGVQWDVPVWPEGTLEDLIERAFEDRVISSLDHPVVRALRGEA